MLSIFAFLVAFQLQLFPSFRKFFLYQFVLDLIIAWVTLVKITLKPYKKTLPNGILMRKCTN